MGQLAHDSKPLDYVDDSGRQWVTAACGHRVGGSARLGDKIAMCPNCGFILWFRPIPVIYPERLPDNARLTTAAPDATSCNASYYDWLLAC